MASDADSIRRRVAEACRVVANAGLAEIFAGHVSHREDGSMFVSAHLHDSGRGLESITPEHVLEVDLDDGTVTPPFLEIPEETVIHTAIFEEREEVNSVVHTHPPYATALSATNQSLVPGTIRAVRLRSEVPIHDAGPRLIHADGEIPEARGEGVAETLGDANALLIRGHGVVTVGRTVPEAITRLYLLERASKLQLLAAGAGGVEPYDETFETLSHRSEGLNEDAYKFLRQQYLDTPFVQ